MAPVTVFLVAIACLLAATAAVRPLALRTGVPEAVWLIGLGVVLRATGLVSTATVAALAPFFAAIALIIVLFEAGRDMVFGAAAEQVGRARKLALVGTALVVPAVALFSQALSGLELLPVWSWTHALMLGALMSCTAPEVFAPTLYRRAHPALVGTLEREAALTGALGIAATACCIDLLSLRVPEGKASAAIAAGFGLGLAFGAFAGLLWITAIRRVGPGRGVYPYTLAAILALYVVTDSLGGIGALAVLVFGAVVSNAGPLVAALFRPRGTIVEAADEDFRAALDDHARTVEITRVLLFTFIGLGLGPPWGLVAMGVVLGLMLVVLRLLAARLVLRGLDERTFSALALGWPRGMLVAGLAALPHAAAVPGTEALTTLVFSAVATTCAAFSVAISPLGHAHVVEKMPLGQGPSGQGEKDTSVGTPVKAAPPSVAQTVAELFALRTGGEAAGSASSPPSAGAPGSPGGALIPGAPAGGAQIAGEPGGRGGTLMPGGALIADEPGVRGGTLILGEPGGALIAGEPGVRGGTLIPGEPGGALIADEPGGRGGALIPGEPGGGLVAGEPGVRGGTLLPGEPVARSGGVLAGVRAGLADFDLPVSGMSARTLVPGEPVAGLRGGTLIPGDAVAGRTPTISEPVAGVSARTPGAGEPTSVRAGDSESGASGGTLAGVSTRTLLPGEAIPQSLPRFAPPGSRAAERTLLRGSGAGAPEIVRHVLISKPAHDAARPTTEAAATTAVGLGVQLAPEAKGAGLEVQSAAEAGLGAQLAPAVVGAPAMTSAGLEAAPAVQREQEGRVVAPGASGAGEVPREPPLLELVNELLHEGGPGSTSGHGGKDEPLTPPAKGEQG